MSYSPEKTAGEFKRYLLNGLKEEKRHFPIWKNRIDYNTYKEVKKLPIFKYAKFKSGFHEEEFNARRRPFGSLAHAPLAIYMVLKTLLDVA